MKRLILALALCLGAAVLAIPATAAEMRGLWVDAHHPGFKTPAEASAMVAKAKECNFNALFIQVRKRGDVYYKSSIEPTAMDVAPGYDPLADVIGKAHAAGMEVHAWVIAYEVFHADPAVKARADQVNFRHPEWLTRDNNGKDLLAGNKQYLDPGVNEVQDYLLAIVSEIAANYNVDGIHMDSVRYPLPQSGYSDAALARFAKETQRTDVPKADDKQWCQWRRDQVTNLIRRSYGAVNRIKPSVKVSASVYGITDVAHDLCLQDWAGWLDAGILDFAVPMVFDGDDQSFPQMVADCLTAGNGKRHVYIGQAGWKLSPDKSLKRMDTAHKAGAQGSVVFSYWYCSQSAPGKGAGLMNALKAGPYGKPDTLPAMAWKPKK